MTLSPPCDFQYYTKTVYWNNFPEILAHLNRIATGDPNKGWMELLKAYPPASRLLSINCGNGWVERELCRYGLARSILGIDISEALLEEARREAQADGLTAEYRVMDANKATLAGLGFDYVLNHAALHHVARIDRLIREILVNMPEHGILINYDYVGPHRNQYPWEHWSRMVELWDRLPSDLRTELRYPHLKTMIATDPTEAVHSELIIATLQRYFDIIEQRALGGAIAYQLLWNNTALLQARNTARGAYWLQKIIEADVEYTDGKVENSYFALLLCRPNKLVLKDECRLAVWTMEEKEREELAHRNGGRYGPRRTLEVIAEKLAQHEQDTKVSRIAADAKVSELENELAQQEIRRENELSTLVANHGVELERLRSDHQVELERLRSEHQVDLERLRSDDQVELERLRSEHQVELERLRSEFLTSSSWQVTSPFRAAATILRKVWHSSRQAS
jgi:SAM-dependent methyltransferase